MNNFKKLGLTALGTTLVASSALAGEISVSGDAGYTFSSEQVGGASATPAKALAGTARPASPLLVVRRRLEAGLALRRLPPLEPRPLPRFEVLVVVVVVVDALVFAGAGVGAAAAGCAGAGAGADEVDSAAALEDMVCVVLMQFKV